MHRLDQRLHSPRATWTAGATARAETEVDARRGALRSRLHACGQVTGRGTTRLVVLFEGEDHTVSIRPHLVRVIPG